MDKVKLASREFETIGYKGISSLVSNIKNSNLDLPDKISKELNLIFTDIGKIIESKPKKGKYNFNKIKGLTVNDINCEYLDVIKKKAREKQELLLDGENIEELRGLLELAKEELTEKHIGNQKKSIDEVKKELKSKNENEKIIKSYDLLELIISNIEEYRKKVIDLIESKKITNNIVEPKKLEDKVVVTKEIKKEEKIVKKEVKKDEKIIEKKEKPFFSKNINEIKEYHTKCKESEDLNKFSYFIDANYNSFENNLKIDICVFLYENDFDKEYIKVLFSKIVLMKLSKKGEDNWEKLFNDLNKKEIKEKLNKKKKEDKEKEITKKKRKEERKLEEDNKIELGIQSDKNTPELENDIKDEKSKIERKGIHIVSKGEKKENKNINSTNIEEITFFKDNIKNAFDNGDFPLLTKYLTEYKISGSRSLDNRFIRVFVREEVFKGDNLENYLIYILGLKKIKATILGTILKYCTESDKLDIFVFHYDEIKSYSFKAKALYSLLLSNNYEENADFIDEKISLLPNEELKNIYSKKGKLILEDLYNQVSQKDINIIPDEFSESDFENKDIDLERYEEVLAKKKKGILRKTEDTIFLLENIQDLEELKGFYIKDKFNFGPKKKKGESKYFKTYFEAFIRLDDSSESVSEMKDKLKSILIDLKVKIEFDDEKVVEAKDEVVVEEEKTDKNEFNNIVDEEVEDDKLNKLEEAFDNSDIELFINTLEVLLSESEIKESYNEVIKNFITENLEKLNDFVIEFGALDIIHDFLNEKIEEYLLFTEEEEVIEEPVKEPVVRAPKTVVIKKGVVVNPEIVELLEDIPSEEVENKIEEKEKLNPDFEVEILTFIASINSNKITNDKFNDKLSGYDFENIDLESINNGLEGKLEELVEKNKYREIYYLHLLAESLGLVSSLDKYREKLLHMTLLLDKSSKETKIFTSLLDVYLMNNK